MRHPFRVSHRTLRNKFASALRRTGAALPGQWWFVGFLILIVLFNFLFVTYQSSDARVVRIGHKKFLLEVADENSERARGLSGRDLLSENQGMLFIFKVPGTYCFWMKDTRIPLDMVWLNDQKQIVHIEQNVRPESYPTSFCPEQSALYVIELSAGNANTLKLQTGQQLDL